MASYDPRNGSAEPMAIVGMGCRWPGGSHSTSQFWEYLTKKINGFKEYQSPRFSVEGFHHPNADRPGSMSMKGAFLVEEDARLFDHQFFGITGLEVETLDPSQRKLLEVVYEAIENAGDTWESVSGSKTGVFVGNFCLDHWNIQSKDWGDNPRPYHFTGAGTSILANRISYIFNLRGPSLTIDTACSSSMYALHLAMNSLRAGDCESAIVASANWIADPGVQIALDKLGALSASGRCHTFDARASGYARGEGYGAIYLKRVPKAMGDSSPIRAMIRGTAINSNGRTGGITRPSAAGQEAVIREAYRNAGNLPFSETSYFECHGTGTYVGDPIEVAAVGRVFGPERDTHDPLLVGSVKSNVGHGEGASALASIMKVVLSLEKGAIAPLYDLQSRNPNIDFDTAKVSPVTEVTPWPSNRLHRASINSFGYGGANGHCIVDHVNILLPDYVAPGLYGVYPKPGHLSTVTNRHTNGHSNGYAIGHSIGVTNGHTNGHVNGRADQDSDEAAHANAHTTTLGVKHHPMVEQSKTQPSSQAITRQWIVLPLSAHNETSFQSNLDRLAGANVSWADLAYTLGSRRSKLAQRSFCVVDTAQSDRNLFAEQKPKRAPLQPARLGFVFTGQGAQWPGMGRELFEYAVFRKAITYLDSVLAILPNRPAWSLLSTLFGSTDDASMIHRAEVAQTVCTAVQVGIVDLLASWSVRPSGVIGHSSGEIGAAYASGRITAAEAIVAAFSRGQAIATNDANGSMLAVGLGLDSVQRFLEGRDHDVKVAAINSPGSVTLSGETPAIEEISTLMTAEGIFNRLLKTDGNAYHSHHMLRVGSRYVEILGEGLATINKLGMTDANHRYDSVPWLSSATPLKSTANIDDIASYWRTNLESPVYFSDALQNLLGDETAAITALVEIGPHPALKSPLEQTLKSIQKTVPYTHTLKRQEDSRVSLLRCTGTLFTLNALVDFAAVNATDGEDGLEHGVFSPALQPYSYTYEGIKYHESRVSKEYRYRSVLKHDLLGSKVAGNAKLRPQWRNILRVKDVPWLSDHRVGSDAILPGAAYVAIAVEAAWRTLEEASSEVTAQGFSLRDVSIKNALVIPEDDRGIELMTSLELVDAASLTATFSISSCRLDTEQWTEHSVGTVKIETGPPLDSGNTVQSTLSFPLPANAHAWYQKFQEIGLDYGLAFRPLRGISVDQNYNAASAIIKMNPVEIEGGQSRYAIHPGSLDGAIQLGLIACHGGRTSNATAAFVPVQISNIYISRQLPEDSCSVVAHGVKRGVRGAELNFQLLGQKGEVLLNAEHVRCITFPYETKRQSQLFASPYTRLVWKPDIRLMSSAQAREHYPPPTENLLRGPAWGLTNKVAHFVVLSIAEKLKVMPQQPHPSGDVGHFLEWIKRKDRNDDAPLMQEARALAKRGQLTAKLEQTVEEAKDILEVQIAKLLHDNIEDILFERRTGVDVIISEGLLTPLYQSGLLMTGIYPQLRRVLGGIAHANPNLSILEIGGGTGGATRVAMDAFDLGNGMKAYKEYTFTDISAGFLSGARESFSEHNMKFSVLDVEIHPVEQGYEASYDLVVACQVLHATSNMHRTLSYCRKLLKPGGQLLVVETNQNFIVPGVVVGTFTGYWAGIPDGRIDAPFQSLEAWDASLRDAGFSGLDVALDDFPAPWNTTSVILSTVLPSEPESTRPATIQVYSPGSKGSALVASLCKEIAARGETVSLVPEHTSWDNKSRVIAILDDDHLLLHHKDGQLAAFQHLATAASVVTVTSSGIVKGRAPDAAAMSGLLRVLQNENPATQYASIDVDADNFALTPAELERLAKSIVDVEFSFHKPVSTAASPQDREFSWHDGAMHIGRHLPDAGSHSQIGVDGRNAKPAQQRLETQGPLRAAFESPGVPGSIYFEPNKDFLKPLLAGEIEVKVAAWALSPQDLELWSGRGEDDHLSIAYSGVVTAVGDKVTHLKVGERVFGLAENQFGNVARGLATLACKVESGVDIVPAAALPWAWSTAVFVFDHVLRLQQGQAILIQAGARDVTAALCDLAKAKDAEIFVVADAPTPATELATILDIAPSHVLSTARSREIISAAAQTRKGKFEAILHTSLQGRLLSKIIACFGKIVNLGRETITDAHMVPSTVSCVTVDMLAVINQDTDLASKVLQAVDDYYSRGIARPVRGVSVLDVGDLPSSIPHLDQHVVVDFTNPKSEIRVVESNPSAHFDPQAAYIVTGGLGGLGQALIRWMAERGATHFVVLSRRGPAHDRQDFVASLAADGVEVQSIACDVSVQDQVSRALEQIAAMRPVKGIVHAAVSYLDLSFDKITPDRWRDSLAAKVQGTRNLHEASLSLSLDFFVMTTSALSLYGFATQSAYTAANSFQDAFARYRRRLGLPASTVSFSLVKDITNVGSDPITLDLFQRNKTQTHDESEFLALLEPAFLNNRTTPTEEPNSRSEDPFSAANLHAYLDPQALINQTRAEGDADPAAKSTGMAPRWYSDARASHMMRAFFDGYENAHDSTAKADDGSKNSVSTLRSAFETAVKRGPEARSSTLSLVTEAILEAVAEMMYVDKEGIDAVKSVADVGVDSLVAAELRRWFLDALGANISMLDLLDPAVSIAERARAIVDSALGAAK